MEIMSFRQGNRTITVRQEADGRLRVTANGVTLYNRRRGGIRPVFFTPSPLARQLGFGAAVAELLTSAASGSLTTSES